MSKVKRFTIKEQEFAQLNNFDRLERDHAYIAKLMREQMKITQFQLISLIDVELADRYKRGFVTVDIDWEKRELVITPTDDAETKGKEVAHLLKNGKQN